MPEMPERVRWYERLQMRLLLQLYPLTDEQMATYSTMSVDRVRTVGRELAARKEIYVGPDWRYHRGWVSSERREERGTPADTSTAGREALQVSR